MPLSYAEIKRGIGEENQATFAAKSQWTIRVGTPYCDQFMKNSPVITVLLIAVCGVGLVVLGLAVGVELHYRQLRRLQPVIFDAQNTRNMVTMLANDAAEYSKSHPAIDVILGPAGVKNAKSGTAAKTAPK